ncbi:MAG: response regulator [Segetibacter sp.]|nr:response regulator [Segetibacter sp.]
MSLTATYRNTIQLFQPFAIKKIEDSRLKQTMMTRKLNETEILVAGGLEVLRQVKSNNDSKLIPVVIMSSSKKELDIVTGYELGVNSFVVKPVEFNNFANAVGELGLYQVLVNQPAVI